MTKTITINLTEAQADTVEGILKARIFNAEFKASQRNTSKLMKEVYLEEVKLLNAVLFQLAQ